MKKGRWTFLIMVLALAFTAGCGTAQREPEKTEKEEEDKLQIGLSFDSFVIERWLGPGYVCFHSAEPWGRGECAGCRGRGGRADFVD